MFCKKSVFELKPLFSFCLCPFTFLLRFFFNSILPFLFYQFHSGPAMDYWCEQKDQTQCYLYAILNNKWEKNNHTFHLREKAKTMALVIK